MGKRMNSKSGTVQCMMDSFKKSTTEMLILSLLGKKPMYVYEIVKELDEKTEGQLHLITLYPAIYRLLGFGFIKEFACCMSEDNRLRKYYSITQPGQEYFSYIQAEYHSLTSAVEQIFNYNKDTDERKVNKNEKSRRNQKRGKSVS